MDCPFSSRIKSIHATPNIKHLIHVVDTCIHGESSRTCAQARDLHIIAPASSKPVPSIAPASSLQHQQHKLQPMPPMPSPHPLIIMPVCSTAQTHRTGFTQSIDSLTLPRQLRNVAIAASSLYPAQHKFLAPPPKTAPSSSASTRPWLP